ncbi:MAG TPA: hypothetical protein VJ719_11700 [Chthoniobacterales bacterium]|nr:hypothetical protein [Chthoniobacterales bacterium]
MWKPLIALIAGVAPVVAQDNLTAYDALRVVGDRFGRAAVNHVISVSGAEGNPQPETWRVVLENPNRRGVREVEVSNGRVTADRPGSDVAGSSEGATINTKRLNLDSSGAYTVASYTAERSHAQFSTVDYTLRTDDRGEPVWIITLHNRSRRPIGTIHIGANRGSVMRTEGLFAGATMEDIQTDEIADDDSEEGIKPFRNTKAFLREQFERAQDGARGMFRRVRRSFVDFINRT